MTDQIKSALIGLFVIASIIIMGIIYTYVSPQVGDHGRMIRARFVNIDKINLGTRVTVAGKPIGEVVDIYPVENAWDYPTDDMGNIYYYELVLEIDSNAKIFSTDEMSIQTSGLMGERTIGITPRKMQEGISKEVDEGTVFYAQASGSMERAIAQFGMVANKIGRTIDTIEGILQENRKNIESTIDNIRQALEGLNGEDKGTLGRLFHEDELYLQTRSVLTKVETLLNDVNHYGVLFHLDKGWQRLRTKRYNILQDIDTPREFRSYFEKEVDQIDTSLNRVSELMELEFHNELIRDKQYQRAFQELVRRVGALQETLNIYNQSLIDESIK